MFEIHNPTASVTQLLVALVACFIPDSRCHQKASDGDFWNPKDVHRSEHGWGSRFSTVEILYHIVPTWCIRRNLLMGCAIRKLAGFIPMAAQFLVCSWNWSPVLSTTGRRDDMLWPHKRNLPQPLKHERNPYVDECGSSLGRVFVLMHDFIDSADVLEPLQLVCIQRSWVLQGWTWHGTAQPCPKCAIPAWF